MITGFCNVYAHRDVGVDIGIAQGLRQFRTAHAPRPLQWRHQPMIDMAAQQAHDTGNILVSQHGKHGICLLVTRHLHQIQHQRSSRMRIVGDIQNHCGPSRQYLKPSWVFDRHKTGADIAGTDRQTLAYRIQRRDAGTGVGELKSTAQRRRWQAVTVAARSTVTPLLLLRLITEIVTDEQQVRADLLRISNHRCRRFRVRADRGPAGTKNRRLLGTNGFPCIAKILHVIEPDTHQQRHIGIKNIHGIKTTTQSDLQHSHIDFALDEQPHRGQRAELEIGQRNTRRCTRRLDCGKSANKIGVIRITAANTHPLVVMNQMRRCVDAGAITGMCQHGFEKTAG